ncbi:MAG: LptF/LptG family permease [Reyranellaceae bacterium]
MTVTGIATGGKRRKGPWSATVLDRYVLARTLMPLSATLLIALLALLLERMVRIMDMLVNQGGPIVLVLKLLANLVPHYLGVALPLALFLGVMVAATRLSADGELDGLQGAGISLNRLLWPLLGLSFVLMLAMLAITGWLQPHTRYQYRALLYVATSSMVDLAIEKGATFNRFGDYTIVVDDIVDRGLTLKGVFIHKVTPEGGVEIMTARSGTAARVPEDFSVLLKLRDGRRLDTPADGGRMSVLSFDSLDLPLELTGASAFRARNAERELTLPELLEQSHRRTLAVRPWLIETEIHARLVRTISTFFMPILGLALGLAAPRGQRVAGVAFGFALIAIFHYGLNFGEKAADLGKVSPYLSLWLPFVVLAALAVWAFRVVAESPRDNAISIALAALDRRRRTLVAALRTLARREGRPT